MVFRRASRRHVLGDDARAFNAEARRRVRVFRNTPWNVGDRILILGEDEDGKTDYGNTPDATARDAAAGRATLPTPEFARIDLSPPASYCAARRSRGERCRSLAARVGAQYETTRMTAGKGQEHGRIIGSPRHRSDVV